MTRKILFPFNASELKIIKKLSTPIKIQDYLDTIPMNFEEDAESNLSPRMVMQKKKAHCMEAALFAAAVLWYHGYEPLLLDLKAFPHEDDHVVALFKQNGLWGAISKTNHATLRFRDPIYRNMRELALSYFHEYFVDATGKKVLYAYSSPFNLKKFGTDWITDEEDLWDLCDLIDASRHYSLLPKASKKFVRLADKMERKTATLREWKE
jgi:hypothetical protein